MAVVPLVYKSRCDVPLEDSSLGYKIQEKKIFSRTDEKSMKECEEGEREKNQIVKLFLRVDIFPQTLIFMPVYAYFSPRS